MLKRYLWCVLEHLSSHHNNCLGARLNPGGKFQLRKLKGSLVIHPCAACYGSPAGSCILPATVLSHPQQAEQLEPLSQFLWCAVPTGCPGFCFEGSFKVQGSDIHGGSSQVNFFRVFQGVVVLLWHFCAD